MSSFAVNVTILLVTGALFLLYWTLFRAHFTKQFKKPNDILVHVPLPHLQKSYQKKTIYGEIRIRQFTLTPNITFTNNKDNDSVEKNILWMIFISGHGDSLDIYDTLINQLYQKLISNKEIINKYSKIYMIAYDRIGYGQSSSFNATISGNKICIKPPTFTSITAYDRAIELLSLLMNIEIDEYKFKLFEHELILIGHSYGGLIAQLFLNVLTNDLKVYYPNICNNNNKKIKLLLIDSSWIGMDKVMGKFEVNKFDCYKDFFLTIFGVQQPLQFYKYPTFNYLKQIPLNKNYEKEIILNIQICKYYRGYGDQLISQWNESLGFWQSMEMFECDNDIKQWVNKIKEMNSNHGINVAIYNLYCLKSIISDYISLNLSNDINDNYLIKNECVDCDHYIHLEKPNVVIRAILFLINTQ